MFRNPSLFYCAATTCAAFSFSINFAHALTLEQCKIVGEVTTSVVNEVVQAKLKLSPRFKESMIGYLVQDGELTCSGPKTIYVDTAEDRGAINLIDDDLKKKKIGLASDGIKFVIAPLPPNSAPLNQRRKQHVP